MFVPLIPIETLFLVDEDRGMKLPFSFKAAMSGWLRAGAWVAGLLFLAGGFAELGEGEPLFGAMSIVCGVLSIASFWVWGIVLGKCSPQRKAEIMGMMGLSPADLGPSPASAYGQGQGGYPQPAAYPQPGAYQPQAYPQPGGYGAPAPGYGAPPAPPQPAMGGYGAPPQAGGYGAPPPPAGGFGGPSPYGGPQPQGYGAPQPQAYGGPQPQGYGGPQPQGYGGPQPQGYGPPGWDPNRR
jgi:hypothetical protein